MTLLWSANNNAFFPLDMVETYKSAGWVLDDAVEATESMMEFYGAAPVGKIRGVGPEGMPTWKDIPQPSDDEKKRRELLDLSNEYKSDIQELNAAWLAAAVNDGENEISKKDIVFAEITDRKARYASERADIISKYE